MLKGLSVVTLVNKEKVYAACRKSLERQAAPDFFEFLPINADGEKLNAAAALNRGIESAKNEWVVCAHQDVLFPDRWLENAEKNIDRVPESVAVIGLVGITPGGWTVGHISDPHGHTRWLPMPAEVLSVDEHLIMLRKPSGVRFDPDNPGFHCYGTDICYSAKKRGWTAMVVDAPVIHLSGGRLDDSFEAAAAWLIEKHGREANYVIPTCAKLICRPSLSNAIWFLRLKLNRKISRRQEKTACGCGDLAYTAPAAP